MKISSTLNYRSLCCRLYFAKKKKYNRKPVKFIYKTQKKYCTDNQLKCGNRGEVVLHVEHIKMIIRHLQFVFNI